jgi:hypothetical protein
VMRNRVKKRDGIDIIITIITILEFGSDKIVSDGTRKLQGQAGGVRRSGVY